MFDRNRCRNWETTELVGLLLSPEARAVLGCWLTETRFLDENLEPAMLPLADADGTGLLDLVMRIDKELSPARILDELLDSGLIEQAALGIFLLRRAAYMPSSSDHQQGTDQNLSPGGSGKTGNRTGYRTRHTDRELRTGAEQA